MCQWVVKHRINSNNRDAEDDLGDTGLCHDPNSIWTWYNPSELHPSSCKGLRVILWVVPSLYELFQASRPSDPYIWAFGVLRQHLIGSQPHSGLAKPRPLHNSLLICQLFPSYNFHTLSMMGTAHASHPHPHVHVCLTRPWHKYICRLPVPVPAGIFSQKSKPVLVSCGYRYTFTCRYVLYYQLICHNIWKK